MHKKLFILYCSTRMYFYWLNAMIYLQEWFTKTPKNYYTSDLFSIKINSHINRQTVNLPWKNRNINIGHVIFLSPEVLLLLNAKVCFQFKKETALNLSRKKKYILFGCQLPRQVYKTRNFVICFLWISFQFF